MQAAGGAQPRLRRAARRLRYVTAALCALIGVGIALAIWMVLADRRESMPAMQVVDGGLHPWAIAFSLALVGLLVVLALLRLVRLLKRVEGGAHFTIARDLRAFAAFLFSAVLVAVLCPALAHIAVSLAAGVRPGPVPITLDLSQLAMLLISGLLFFVARLLDEAERIAEEARQIL